MGTAGGAQIINQTQGTVSSSSAAIIASACIGVCAVLVALVTVFIVRSRCASAARPLTLQVPLNSHLSRRFELLRVLIAPSLCSSEYVTEMRLVYYSCGGPPFERVSLSRRTRD